MNTTWERPPEYDDEPDPPDERPFDYYDEPIGSCEWCGTNLYEEDDIDLCSGCSWQANQNRGGEDCGFQPVV